MTYSRLGKSKQTAPSTEKATMQDFRCGDDGTVVISALVFAPGVRTRRLKVATILPTNRVIPARGRILTELERSSIKGYLSMMRRG